MRLISQPYRRVGGRAATVDQDSDGAVAQRLGALAATIRGERDDAPAFGVTDPTFGRLDLAELVAGAALFGPDVAVTGLDASPLDGTSERLVITWQAPDVQESAL